MFCKCRCRDNIVHLNLDNNQATVYLRSWHAQGRTWGDDTESALNGRVVFSIQELLNLPSRHRCGHYQESLRSSKFSIEYQAHHLRINRFGDAQMFEEYSDIRVNEAAPPLEGIPIVNRTTAGKFSTNIEIVSKTDRMAAPRWIPSSDSTAQHVEGVLRFRRPLDFNSGPVSFTISSQVFNAFALNASQRKRMYDEEKPECYGRSVLHPIETLFLIVHFPSSIQTPAFDIVVKDPDGNRNALEENWCRPHLRVSELTRTVSLTVSKPLISHNYQITWELDPAAEVVPSSDPSVEREEEARLIVQKLLQLDTKLENSPEHPLHGIFETLRKDLLESYPSKADTDEQFDIGLLVYDESINRIKPVAGILRPEYWRWRLYEGQGASGRAHKLNEAVLYVHSRVDSSTDWYIGPPEPVAQPQVVLSVPIRYPIEGKDGWIVGVLTVASASLASGLLRLYERKENVLVLIEYFHKEYFQKRILPVLGLARLSEA